MTLAAVSPVSRVSVIPFAWCPPLDSSRAGAVVDWLESGEGAVVAALAGRAETARAPPPIAAARVRLALCIRPGRGYARESGSAAYS
ncbi:hypothetical protein [Arthrobacter sp. UYEF21]|uniref:hypothetical protein n=1 Tax=Arthrobacter sp. UYEF21 TaxID=1756364 RepID=UPI003392663B